MERGERIMIGRYLSVTPPDGSWYFGTHVENALTHRIASDNDTLPQGQMSLSGCNYSGKPRCAFEVSLYDFEKSLSSNWTKYDTIKPDNSTLRDWYSQMLHTGNFSERLEQYLGPNPNTPNDVKQTSAERMEGGDVISVKGYKCLRVLKFFSLGELLLNPDNGFSREDTSIAAKIRCPLMIDDDFWLLSIDFDQFVDYEQLASRHNHSDISRSEIMENMLQDLTSVLSSIQFSEGKNRTPTF